MDDLDRLQRDMDRAADELEDKAERLVRASTLRTEALAKQFSPVRTGFLRSSITSEFETTGSTVRGEVGPGAHYAGYVHFGTSRQSPQPFLYSAADIVEPRFYAGAEAIGASALDVSVRRSR